MRLSDAIATGRVLLIPRTGVLWRRELDGTETGCALGMAGKAAGLSDISYESVMKAFSTSYSARITYPCQCADTHYLDQTMDSAIVHLFDVHVQSGDWTLDGLIDWVRANEPPEAPQVTALVEIQPEEEHVHAT